MQVLQFVAILAVGAAIGGVLGYFGKCTTGACPLTANPWRGAAFGALFAALMASSLIFPGGSRTATAAGNDEAGAAEESGAGAVIHLSKTEDFDKYVLNAKGVVLVDFYADWCPPCRMLGPVIEKAAKVYGDKVRFVKVNVDRHESLARKYHVRSIPNLILFKDGKQVDSDVGFRPLRGLCEWIDKYVK